jgi:quercetin dioxygenase-like cupin family protein
MAPAPPARSTPFSGPLGRVCLTGLAGAIALVGCGGEGPAERPGVRGALGGDAKVVTLARAQLVERPPGRLAWVADELELAGGRALEHRHGPAFVYVRSGTALLERPGHSARLERGRGAFVPGGTRHQHAAAGPATTLWEIRLATPRAAPPPGGRRVFESKPLRGIPAMPLASFLEVKVPARGGRTTVHTHPGPEFIYQVEGRIEYQNALIGTRKLGPGGAEGIPPATAVQKRNPFAADARFLSWFLVDPDRPFAPPSEF